MIDEAQPAIRLRGVTKSFGAVRAVHNLDLTIDAGETVALLGPNGAGKSTAIGLLLGLSTPDSGELSLFGTSPDRAVQAGQVGAMLQSAGFVPNARVRELLELSRALYPHPLPTERILATAGLTELADRRLDKLSGGEAQRARFAFALAGDPRLLVLDEPTAAMDVATRRSFWAAMRRYSAAGHTVLFATHYLEEADAFADRIVVVARGRVIADGTGADIKKLGPNPLTDRERDVLAAAADGSTVADIAARLHLSESTVRNYLSAAIGKTSSRNRIEAVQAARGNGWL